MDMENIQEYHYNNVISKREGCLIEEQKKILYPYHVVHNSGVWSGVLVFGRKWYDLVQYAVPK